MSQTQTSAAGVMTTANAVRALRVLTLTPFYPSANDPSQGCFVSEPLAFSGGEKVTNEVIAVQPFYRRPAISAESGIPSQWRRYFSFPGNAGLPTSGELLSISIRNQVHAMHAANPFDLVHAHGALPCGRAARKLSGELKIPFVVSVHGLDAFAGKQAGRLLAGWCCRTSAEVYRDAAAVICISEKVRHEVTLEKSANARVIYNGVDERRFSPGQEAGEAATILCVGNLIPIKGHELLLRSFADLAPLFPDARLEVIGDGPERERLMHLVTELGLRQQVCFRGRCRREEVAEAMRLCSVFALPSSYEGLGCVYLEAMACAKPAIGCRGQGIDEVIEHGKTGLLIEAGNQNELTESLRVLLSNPEYRARLGAAARNCIVQRFTLKHQATAFAELYRECLK